MIPERLLHILRGGSTPETARFPQTEIYNEGWMLRLLLDAFKRLAIRDHPLQFFPRSEWFSEVRLSSPFRPRARGDKLAEGFTNADGVVGHFNFRPETKAGLHLSPGCQQFVVVEAKMFSNLSPGVTNARHFDQAARNVACMAEAIANSGTDLQNIADVGFYVVAPPLAMRSARRTNLEACVSPESIQAAVNERISGYEAASRAEADELRYWERHYFAPLLDRLVATNKLAVVSWDDCVEAVRDEDPATADELYGFYQRCLELAVAQTVQG